MSLNIGNEPCKSVFVGFECLTYQGNVDFKSILTPTKRWNHSATVSGVVSACPGEKRCLRVSSVQIKHAVKLAGAVFSAAWDGLRVRERSSENEASMTH